MCNYATTTSSPAPDFRMLTAIIDPTEYHPLVLYLEHLLLRTIDIVCSFEVQCMRMAASSKPSTCQGAEALFNCELALKDMLSLFAFSDESPWPAASERSRTAPTSSANLESLLLGLLNHLRSGSNTSLQSISNITADKVNALAQSFAVLEELHTTTSPVPENSEVG